MIDKAAGAAVDAYVTAFASSGGMMPNSSLINAPELRSAR